MLYHWRCSECKANGQRTVVEVIRSFAESDQGPEVCCPRCESASFYKIIAPTAPPITKSESDYPVRIPKLIKEHVTVNGEKQYQMTKAGPVPVIRARDAVFTTRKQQDTWMEDNGYMRTEDNYDSTIGRDQSIFNRNLQGAPSEMAAKFEKSVVFVSEEDVKNAENYVPYNRS